MSKISDARNAVLARDGYRSLEDRFWAKVDRGDGTGCWLWTGAKGRYGAIRSDGKMRSAHRLAYEWSVGPIPEGLELDHLCRNTRCVRPDHLEAVTHQENMRRGRHSSGWIRKQRCGRHDEALTATRQGRMCLSCDLARKTAYRRRQGQLARTPENLTLIGQKQWEARRRNAA